MVRCVGYDNAVDRGDVCNFNVECYIDPIPQPVSMTEKASYDFVSCINTRSNISIFYTSVGSANTSSSLCGLFSNDLESIFLQINNIGSIISDTLAEKPKTEYPYFISKVWDIGTSLASKSLVQST